MGTRRIIRVIFAIIIVGIGITAYSVFTYLSPAPPDPLYTGERIISPADLPEDLQGQDEAALRERLAELVAKGQGDRPEQWWSSRLEAKECREARVLAVSLGDTQTAIRSLLWLARRRQFDDSLLDAMAALDTAEAEARAGGFLAERAQCHEQRSDCLEWMNLYDAAITEGEQALELFIEIDSPNKIVYLLSSIGMLHSHRKSDHATALEYYERCQEYADRVDPVRMTPVTALNAYVLMGQGRYPDSVALMKKSLDYARGSEDKRYELMELTSLAEIQLTLNLRGAGEETLKAAMELGPAVDKAYSPFEAHRNMAEHLALLGEPQAGIDLLQAALLQIDECEQAVDPEDERAKSRLHRLRSERIVVLGSLGKLSLLQEDYAAALKYFGEADSFVEHNGFVMPAERMEMGIAAAQLGLEQYSEALVSLQAARDCGSLG